MEKDSPHELWKPRYWPLWAAVVLVYSAAHLPYACEPAIGSCFGLLYAALQPRRRAIARDNLKRCFPEKSPAEIRRLARAHFRALGMGFIETAMGWWRPDDRLPPVVIEGLGHLREALSHNRGVLLLTAHFTALEIGARFISREVAVGALYRPGDNPVLDLLMRRGRERRTRIAIPRDDIRTLLRTLAGNIPVWYATDQGYTGKNSALVPFFGIPAPTHLGLSRLARASGAPVVPFCVRRLPGRAGFRVLIAPPLSDFPGPDPVEDANRVHRLLEQYIRMMPEQYLWSHDRFKDHPRGRPGPMSVSPE